MMQFTESEINQLGEAYKKRIREGQKELKEKEKIKIAEMQEWLKKHNVEDRDIMRIITNKFGSGKKNRI